MPKQYTAEDTKCAMYAQRIDDLNEDMYDGKKTPFQIIYEEEAESLGNCVKDQKEVWIDHGSYGEWGIEQMGWDFSKPEDRRELLEMCVNPQLARYNRGKELLQSNKLISSDYWMCSSDWHYDKMIKGKKVTSVAVSVSVGYIHTTEHFKWVALAEKKAVRA